MRHVQTRARVFGQHQVARQARLLRSIGDASKAQPLRHLALVDEAARAQARVFAMLDDGKAEGPGGLERPPHQPGRLDRTAIIRERHGARFGQRSKIGQRLAFAAGRNGGDRKHSSKSHLPRPLDQSAGGLNAVVHGPGVGHRTHGGEPSGYCRREARLERFRVRIAGLPQVDVQVDESGRDHLTAGVHSFVGAEREIGRDTADDAVLNQDVEVAVQAVLG